MCSTSASTTGSNAPHRVSAFRLRYVHQTGAGAGLREVVECTGVRQWGHRVRLRVVAQSQTCPSPRRGRGWRRSREGHVGLGCEVIPPPTTSPPHTGTTGGGDAGPLAHGAGRGSGGAGEVRQPGGAHAANQPQAHATPGGTRGGAVAGPGVAPCRGGTVPGALTTRV